MTKLSPAQTPFLSFGLQVLLVALAPNLIMRTFYNPDDPWSSVFVAYVFLIGMAILFPVLNFLVLRSTTKHAKSLPDPRRTVLICRLVLALSVVLSCVVLFWNQIIFFLQRI